MTGPGDAQQLPDDPPEEQGELGNDARPAVEGDGVEAEDPGEAGSTTPSFAERRRAARAGLNPAVVEGAHLQFDRTLLSQIARPYPDLGVRSVVGDPLGEVVEHHQRQIWESVRPLAASATTGAIDSWRDMIDGGALRSLQRYMDETVRFMSPAVDLQQFRSVTIPFATDAMLRWRDFDEVSRQVVAVSNWRLDTDLVDVARRAASSFGAGTEGVEPARIDQPKAPSTDLPHGGADPGGTMADALEWLRSLPVSEQLIVHAVVFAAGTIVTWSALRMLGPDPFEGGMAAITFLVLGGYTLFLNMISSVLLDLFRRYGK